MFNLQIENSVLGEALKQLLERVYGADYLVDNDDSKIIITDKVGVCRTSSFEQKRVIFLSSDENALKSVSDGINQIALPLKASSLLHKCNQIVKKITVPDLSKVIKIQGLTFDPGEFSLFFDATGSKTILTEKERNILILLFEAGEEAVSREAMLEKIWNYAPDLETHTLETHIYRLRQKIEQDPAQPKILVTEEKGYRLLT